MLCDSHAVKVIDEATTRHTLLSSNADARGEVDVVGEIYASAKRELQPRLPIAHSAAGNSARCWLTVFPSSRLSRTKMSVETIVSRPRAMSA